MNRSLSSTSTLYRVLAGLVIGLLAVLPGTVPVVQAQALVAPYCLPDVVPGFTGAFLDLNVALGRNVIGVAIECPHINPANGDVDQQTTRGLTYYRQAVRMPVFFDGTTHYGLVPKGVITWTSDSPDAPGYAPQPTPPLPPLGPRDLGTRDNPIPIGQSIDLSDNWRVAVTTVNANATAALAPADPSNTPPPPGYSYVLANVIITNISVDPRLFNHFRLWALGPQSTTPYTQQDNSCGVLPNQLPDTLIGAGQLAQGSACWTVLTSDVPGLLMFDSTTLFTTQSYLFWSL